MKIQITKEKSIEEDLHLHDEIIHLIAQKTKENIHELEGYILMLSAYSDTMEEVIDIERAKELLKIENNKNNKRITLNLIAEETCKYYKIELKDLKSKTRKKDIANARHIAMFLSRKIINKTQKEIGTFYGDRDHSSVIHALGKIEELIKTKKEVSQDISTIETNLFV